ncbi:MAG: metalloregulator ArsR/SmtB family transcription factor [Candidatus Eisenbacteria bacterium]|nr:metalloregulator ArsR/SmtB family transcription factor [Candidatus Eisenbacteria bacterium]
MFAVLAPPRRFELLSLLVAGGNRSVSQLAEAVGLSQSCTTRHLQALESMGLVRGERDGKRVVFRVHATDVAAGSVLTSLGVGGTALEPGEYDARPRTEALPTPSRPAAASPRDARRRGGARPEGPGQSTGAPPSPAAPAAGIPPAGPAVSQPSAESAIESATRPAPMRRRDEIEDFLL